MNVLLALAVLVAVIFAVVQGIRYHRAEARWSRNQERQPWQ